MSALSRPFAPTLTGGGKLPTVLGDRKAGLPWNIYEYLWNTFAARGGSALMSFITPLLPYHIPIASDRWLKSVFEQSVARLYSFVRLHENKRSAADISATCLTWNLWASEGGKDLWTFCNHLQYTVVVRSSPCKRSLHNPPEVVRCRAKTDCFTQTHLCCTKRRKILEEVMLWDFFLQVFPYIFSHISIWNIIEVYISTSYWNVLNPVLICTSYI